MINITFDVPGGLSQKSIDLYMKSILRDVGALARAEIIRLAKTELKTSLRDYERAIAPPRFQGKNTIVIEVFGTLANMIEKGWSGGDMRQWLSSNPKVRVSAAGKRYAYIPFRFGSPRASGRSGTPMTKSVHAVAKKLKPTLTIPFAEKTKWGEQVPAGLEPKLRPHHKTDIYAGMYRMEKTYRSAVQSSYVTFRTISEANPIGWYHPGIRQYAFLERAAAYVQEIFPTVVDQDPIDFEGS